MHRSKYFFEFIASILIGLIIATVFDVLNDFSWNEPITFDIISNFAVSLSIGLIVYKILFRKMKVLGYPEGMGGLSIAVTIVALMSVFSTVWIFKFIDKIYGIKLPYEITLW